MFSYLHWYLAQVNGLDVSSCSHEEAVRVLSQASQPIMVEVKQRDQATDLPAGPVRTSQEQSVQTESELANFCDNCSSVERDQASTSLTSHTYYNYKEEENFIYPELQYEVSSVLLYWWEVLLDQHLFCFNMNLTYTRTRYIHTTHLLCLSVIVAYITFFWEAPSSPFL